MRSVDSEGEAITLATNFMWVCLSLIGEIATRLHRDERGMELPTAIMVLAMISIPLIIVLIRFASGIVAILNESVDRLRPGA